MEESKFREILTDYIDDNGVIHMDGYKTEDPDEEGVTIAFIINGEAYFRNPEDQFDPYVKEVLSEIQSDQIKKRSELEEKILKAVVEVVYTIDAKPRLEFTNGSPLGVKLSIIKDGVDKIIGLL